MKRKPNNMIKRKLQNLMKKNIRIKPAFMNNKYKNFIEKTLSAMLYYNFILLGLCAVSCIIWSRFIRTRIVRDILDYLFTALRFWILLYICCIYAYTLKSLLKPKEVNRFISLIMDIIYYLMKMFDDLIKYIQKYSHKNH